MQRLTDAAGAVTILAPPGSTPDAGRWPVMVAKGGFVAQAAVLDAARVVWQRRGLTVAVAAPSDGAARRWRALAGLDPDRPGTTPAAVLIVDRADRRTTDELTAIVEQTARSGTQVELVEGGTLPARRGPVSQGLGWLGDALGRAVPPLDLDPRPGPGREAAGGGPDFDTDGGDTDGGDTDGGVAAGRLTAYQRGHRALDHVVARWSVERGDGGAVLRMVGLGPAECDELNRRARTELRRAGALTGDDVMVGGRPFAIGDEVTTTRRAPLPAGAVGRVIAIRSGDVVVSWAGAPVALDAWSGRHLRHAYATTPGRLHFHDGPLVALGEPADLGRHRDRLVAGALVAPTGPRPSRPGRRHEVLATHLDGLVRIAATDPGRAGLPPLPDDAAGRRQWRLAAIRATIGHEVADAITGRDRPGLAP